MRSLPAQHSGVRVGQGAQFEKSQDHSPSGPVDQRSAYVRQDSPVRSHHGSPNPQQAGEQAVRVPGRGQIPRVSLPEYAVTDLCKMTLSDPRLIFRSVKKTASYRAPGSGCNCLYVISFRGMKMD